MSRHHLQEEVTLYSASPAQGKGQKPAPSLDSTESRVPSIPQCRPSGPRESGLRPPPLSPQSSGWEGSNHPVSECSQDANEENLQQCSPSGAPGRRGSFRVTHAPAHRRHWGREVRGQEEDRAAPLPDVVNHRSLKDTEEPVLLGVLWPFLHFSPGGRGWRERGKQVSWLQNDVLIILPETKGRRGRTVKGSYGKPLFLDDSSYAETSHGVRGHQLAESVGVGPVGLDAEQLDDQRRKNRARRRQMSQPFSVPLQPLSRHLGGAQEALGLSPGTLSPLLRDAPTAFPGKEKSLELP